MSPTELPLTIVDLPKELRKHILSFLLPDLDTIECDQTLSPCRDSLPRNWPPRGWKHGNGPSVCYLRTDREVGVNDGICHPQVLRVNRKLYDDGVEYLYRQKTYKISVFNYGFEFLRHSGQLDELPPLPYHHIKEFVIEVNLPDLKETGTMLRWNLLWLCGLIQKAGIHFRRLKVEFQNNDYHGNARDEVETYSAPPSRSDDPFDDPFDEKDDCNAHLVAYKNGFWSTLGYLFNPLVLLPVAKQCAIQLPTELQDTDSQDLATWYEEGLNGTYPFEDDWWLQREKADFEWKVDHPSGSSESCECVSCKDFFKKLNRTKAWYWSDARLMHRVALKDYQVGVEEGPCKELALASSTSHIP
ncbi:MAG: hypothetical protein Q9170_001824 [Blastenia crenularia]